jgi:hypothetical protein
MDNGRSVFKGTLKEAVAADIPALQEFFNTG